MREVPVGESDKNQLQNVRRNRSGYGGGGGGVRGMEWETDGECSRGKNVP
jgi:hypothetical protein